MKLEPEKKRAEAKHDFEKFGNKSYDYKEFVAAHSYESNSEKMAIHRLLDGKHFKCAVDVGGGYGRLSVLLEQFADKVILTDPSQRQLDLAKEYLKGHSEISLESMQASELKFDDGSIDLLTMVRVMHHLPNPGPEFDEIARVLSGDGLAIIEVANYTHIRNRIKFALKRKKFPDEAVEVRSELGGGMTRFYNHNPQTVRKQLAHSGLTVDRILSVSNLQSPAIKRMLPKRVMLAFEGLLQQTLANSHFGPSVFFLVRKA